MASDRYLNKQRLLPTVKGFFLPSQLLLSIGVALSVCYCTVSHFH